jgi:large subunit ribosomal protein L4
VVVLDNAHEDVAEAKTKWLDQALDSLLGAGALAAGDRQHSVLLAEISADETTPGALIGRRRDVRSSDFVPTFESRAKRASKNLPHVHVMHQRGLNVYDILRYRSLAITKDALKELVSRIDAPIKR